MRGSFEEQSLKRGILTYNNNDEWKGTVEMGEAVGEGQLTYANGCIFRGTFINGMRHGDGTFVIPEPNKRIYDGRWLQDAKCKMLDGDSCIVLRDDESEPKDDSESSDDENEPLDVNFMKQVSKATPFCHNIQIKTESKFAELPNQEVILSKNF